MKKVTKISGEKPQEVKNKKLRVAAYCRVSTDSDAQLESLEAQKNHYNSYISRHEDWVMAGLYFDEGISGTKKEKRSELLRMIADCEAGKIDFVITKSVSRFSRNTTDCLEMVRKLLNLEIPIYFEKENLNTMSMKSELFLSVLSSMAEAESTSISQNSKWAIQRRFMNGTFKISSPPYGYIWDGKEMVVEQEKAEVVRWIFGQVLSGMGTYTLAGELNRKGVPTQRGGRWAAATVRNIIVNEKYTGDVIFQKTYTDSRFKRHTNDGERNQYALTEHHEAIISREDYEAANAMLAQHAREKGAVKGEQKYRESYCLSSKIVCGECGATFKRRTHSSSKHKYAAWCCNTHLEDKARCSMKFIRDDELKVAFMTMINKLVFGYKKILIPYMAAIREEGEGVSLRGIQELQTLLMENADQRETLTKLMGQGYIEQILYNKENNKLLAKADSYRKEKEALSKDINGGCQYYASAESLLKYAEKGIMMNSFDEVLFEHIVDKVRVLTRDKVAFELKCGLTFEERM